MSLSAQQLNYQAQCIHGVCAGSATHGVYVCMLRCVATVCGTLFVGVHAAGWTGVHDA